jgi:hypothetical protein
VLNIRGLFDEGLQAICALFNKVVNRPGKLKIYTLKLKPLGRSAAAGIDSLAGELLVVDLVIIITGSQFASTVYPVVASIILYPSRGAVGKVNADILNELNVAVPPTLRLPATLKSPN